MSFGGKVCQNAKVEKCTQRYTVTSRTGNSSWTAGSLQAWLETLTGARVEVVERPHPFWLLKSKTVTFEVRIEGTPEQAQKWEKSVLQQVKLKRIQDG